MTNVKLRAMNSTQQKREDVMSRGGKRDGAGRKPLPEGMAKVPYSTKLSPKVVQYLRQCQNAAQTLEAAVKRSQSFRLWKSNSDLLD